MTFQSPAALGWRPGPDHTDNTLVPSLPPVLATGLRFFATGGDDFYSVSEVQVFTPEPASMVLVGLGLAAAGGLKWRLLRAAR